MPNSSTDQPAPSCARCRRRHLVGLACWSGRYAARLVTAILETQGRACWLGYECCTGTATTADHVVPRKWGGTDEPANLRPACLPCNSRRQDRDPFEPDPEPRPTGVGLSPRWRTAT